MVLLQSGLDEKWSADSMECYCYLRNTQDLLSDGKTPYERRFGMPLTVQLSRSVQWSNITWFLLKTCRDCISSARKSYLVYFLALYCTREGSGKETKWSQTLRHWQRWTHLNELHARRLNAKELLTPMKGDNFLFTQSQMEQSTPREIRRLKPFTLIRDRPERGEEEQEVFRGESDERPSPNPLQDDSTLEDPEAKNEFWSIAGDFIYRHHVDTRVKPEQHKRRLMYCWWNVLKIAGKLMENENCRMHGQVSRDSLYWMRSHLTDTHGPGGDWRGNKRPQDPTMYGQICWRGIFFIEPYGEEFKRMMKNACRKLEIPLPAAKPCRIQLHQHRESCCTVGHHKTKYACIVEADECMRIRMERSQSKNHKDHIGRKRQEFIESQQPGAQIYSHVSSNEYTRCEGNSG